MLELKKYGENLDAMHEKVLIRDKSLILIMPKGKSGTFPEVSCSRAVEAVSEKEATQDIGEAGTSNLGKESLMESTIHKVSVSFLFRLNHMGVSSEDMGCNYIMEKVELLV